MYNEFMKKNKFLYPFCSPRIGEIINIPTSMHPVICLEEKRMDSYQLPKIPDTIFHYCNKQGFDGIIKSNSLWLSTLRKTNDELEIIYLYQLFKTYIRTQNFNLQDQIDIFKLDMLYKSNLQNAFSTSFTILKDISWQWNEYGDKNKGFVIGFSTKKLTTEYNLPERTLFVKSPSLLKVDYNEKSHKKILKSTINKCIRNEYSLTDIALFLAKISCLCKTNNWKKEQEWRLLHFPLINPEIEMSIYQNHSFLTRLDDNKYAYKIPSGAITEIIIGSKNPISIETVKQFLGLFYSTEEISKIKIYRSRSGF